MSRWNSLALVLFVVPIGSCFVSPGDCVQEGVQVDPCFVAARPGQTLTLNATVIGAPTAAVQWEVSSATNAAFAIQPNGNSLTLISQQNTQGSFSVTARSLDNETIRGGSVITTKPAGFNPQPSPFVFTGGPTPNRNFIGTATASGGGVYYVAYADFNSPDFPAVGGAPPPAVNHFVKQFDLQTNVVLGEVPDQFDGFGGGTIVPNIAADCAGNGYWIDDRCLDGCNGDYALFQLAPGSSTPVQPQFNFPSNTTPETDTLTVGCDGAIYFVASVSRNQILYTIPVYGDQPIPIVVTGRQSFAFFVDCLAVDFQGRLLAGDENQDGSEPLQRLLLGPVIGGVITATVDTDFTPGLTESEGVSSIAVDPSGIVYATVFGTQVRAFNELGDPVYTVSSYLHLCPSGCTSADCNTIVPFQDIQSIAVTANGGLRVLDDVSIPVTDPAPCQETVRLILIDPQ